MFKWLAVCFIALAVAKWNQNVQATDELNEEERRLLETLEEKLDQDTQETDVCETEECFMDYACASQCCSDQCVAADDYEGCMDVCMNGVPDMVSPAKNQGSPSGEVNKYQKKLWGARFRRVRIRLPPARRVVRTVARRVLPALAARYVVPAVKQSGLMVPEPGRARVPTFPSGF